MDIFGVDDNRFGLSSSDGGGFQSNSQGAFHSPGGAYGGWEASTGFTFTQEDDANEHTEKRAKKKETKGVEAFHRSSGNRSGSTECCMPCSIALILRSVHSSRLSEEGLVVHGKPVGAVVVCGWIVETEQLSSQIRVKLCDGSGLILVYFDVTNDRKTETHREDSPDTEVGETGEDGRGWPAKKASILKPGRLVRVVGAVVNVGGKSGSTLPNIEACHFRPVEDPREYVCFADVEIAFAAMQMTNGEEILGDEIKELTIKDEHPGKASEVESWESVALPDSLNHVTDVIQQSILRAILQQPQTTAGRITTYDIVQLLRRYSGDEVREGLSQLIEDGEVIQVHGDFVDVA